MAMETFPIDLQKYIKVSVNPWNVQVLPLESKLQLLSNIQLCRDAIVFFTSTGAASGYGGHTGGAYDTVPETMILDAFFRGCPDKFVPTFFDEAGHRVATQYLMAVLEGAFPAENLMKYRVGHEGLPGHPELGLTPGVKFSSGRLGHIWPFLNGVCLADRSRIVCCLGSDGSQQEGNNAEAARIAVAQGLKIKLFIDDNNVTISGHTSDYMKGFDLAKTLRGHGLTVFEADGENIDELYTSMRDSILLDGPAAVIVKRKMCPGFEGLEGTTHGHDAAAVAKAVPYLERRGHSNAVAYLKTLRTKSDPYTYKGSKNFKACRVQFGETLKSLLSDLTPNERAKNLLVDCDLEGSNGLKICHEAFPEVFLAGGIMERAAVSAAAGFGWKDGKQGIFSTFSAFLEMCCSEVTMARLNGSNFICHYCHAGVDDMSDNTCHFGLNNMFADNGLDCSSSTTLYFPADCGQMNALLKVVFPLPGQRFIFSTRSKVPAILTADGEKEVFGSSYSFVPGKDDIVREGKRGVIVSYGDCLYRCVDAVDRLREEGIDVMLVNKASLNVVDEDMMKIVGNAPFVLVFESLSRKNGLGLRFGTWLLERGYAPRFARFGAHLEGCCGTFEQIPHQGLDPVSVIAQVKKIMS